MVNWNHCINIWENVPIINLHMHMENFIKISSLICYLVTIEYYIASTASLLPGAWICHAAWQIRWSCQAHRPYPPLPTCQHPPVCPIIWSHPPPPHPRWVNKVVPAWIRPSQVAARTNLRLHFHCNYVYFYMRDNIFNACFQRKNPFNDIHHFRGGSPGRPSFLQRKIRYKDIHQLRGGSPLAPHVSKL